ncbi:RsmD family RNA methyltransferase [Alienimonas californiensis]|uniref:Ribosomal RNA small subunit methyltransferase D n=1 Tax=Alienimonas californiensis TaxID=2527989 RepID=A0A517PEE8_9PLAN|nr:RsmD family RNA methyltransferase [Alienimonas californiensis]QDT17742.1 Ribosomal RNA small subunit methyltransferase D [Alienimonas californiensis]
MRIVAGKFKRRSLLPPAGEQTRPITDRAKEQLFENLGGDLSGRRVLDAFAGTGTIGLEALSRGAAGCVFLEADKRTHGLLKQNVERLGVTDVSVTWRVDILRTSFRPRPAPEHTLDLLPYDLLFFDPPYKMASGIVEGRPLYKSLQRVAKPELCAANAEMILRVPTELDIVPPPEWTQYRELRVGGMKFLMCDRAPFDADAVGDDAEADDESDGAAGEEE